MMLHSHTEKCIGDNVSISYCHLKSGKKFLCSLLQMSQKSYDILTLSPEECVLWAVCAACDMLPDYHIAGSHPPCRFVQLCVHHLIRHSEK